MNKNDSKAVKITSLITQPIGLAAICYFFYYINELLSAKAFLQLRVISAVFFALLILLLTINLIGLIISSIGKTIDNFNIKYFPVTIAEVVYLCLSMPVIEVIWFIMLFVDILRVSGGALFVYLIIQIPMLMSIIMPVIKKCNLIDAGTKQRQIRSNPQLMQNPVINGLYNEFLAPPQNPVQPNVQMQAPVQNGVQQNIQRQTQNTVQSGVQQNIQRQTQSTVQNGVSQNSANNTQKVNNTVPVVKYDSRMPANNSQCNPTAAFIQQSHSTEHTLPEKTKQEENPKKESCIKLPYEELDSSGKPVRKPSPPVNLIKK